MADVALRTLSKQEYLATFAEPMRRLGENESYRPISLKDYLGECILALGLPTTIQDIQIQHVYLSGNKKHSHVLFYYGQPNRYLVLVISHDSDSVMGHYLLDLNAEYGLHAV
jgi:hypothetical protein